MRKLIKNIFWTGAVVMMTLQSARAFSFGGPDSATIGGVLNGGQRGDAWEQPVIGYNLGGDINTPKNIGEAYRRVTPVMYYAMDSTFINFFGLTGTTNIDAAFAMMNGVLCGQTNNSLFLSTPTNGIVSAANNPYTGTSATLSPLNTLDSYTTNLVEFPMESQQLNYTAEASLLTDLKSVTLLLLAEQLGLADAERYVWTLHSRVLPAGGTCPANMEYEVVQRNYGFLNSTLNQIQYSSYVNDILYTYEIIENCTGGNPLAYTAPLPVDIYADADTSVASQALSLYGGYYTGLTRDDVGGLRYMLSSNNVTWEATSPSGSQLFTISTNITAPTVFPPNGALATATNAAGYYYYDGTYGYGDLAALLAFAKTNNQATLQAAYPGLVISSVTTTWIIASNATYTAYFAPPPYGSPYGTAPQLVVVTNYTPFFQFLYNYTFGNVFTNHFSAHSSAVVQTVTASAPTGSPYGTTLITNSATVSLPGQISGDFFILPPFYENVCPLDLASPPITTVLAITNLIATASTNTVLTNYTSSVYVINYFTNYQYVIYPVTCAQAAAPPALREGIGRIGFIRANYDSLLGQFFSPLTNDYAMVMITNSQKVTEHYRRVVTVPDFLFRAEDEFNTAVVATRNLNFDQSQAPAGLAGPGTIVPSTTITYDKVGDIYANGEPVEELAASAPYLTTQTQGSAIGITNGLSIFLWASFDGSTNPPVVYPSGASLANIINQLYIQVTPTSVPDGTAGVSYNGGAGVTFMATGGQPPYIWAVPNLPALVPGMSFDPATATLSGTPTSSGTFSFTLQVTDAVNRVVSLNYSITIH